MLTLTHSTPARFCGSCVVDLFQPSSVQLSKALRHTMPTKRKMLGKEEADYFSGKKFIEYLQTTEFFGEDKLLRTRADCTRFGAMCVVIWARIALPRTR